MVKKWLIGALFILLFLLTTVQCTKEVEGARYKIVFWKAGSISTKDIGQMEGLSYEELSARYGVEFIFTDEFVKSYYWDEQVIDFDSDRVKLGEEEGIPFSEDGLFSIVFDDKVLFTGINRLNPKLPELAEELHGYPILSYRFIYDESGVRASGLSIRPRYKFIYISQAITVQLFTKREKSLFLSPKVYKYFKSKGKIVC